MEEVGVKLAETDNSFSVFVLRRHSRGRVILSSRDDVMAGASR